MSSLTLIISYYSLDELFTGNWFVCVVYVGGSLFGKYLATSVFHSNSIRKSLYELLNKRD
jgi:hypothetical protein